MIIKRVVVQGFKTYAKKTSFIFDPGITAIVGPNGSGKSNVSDAIRWCFGEQSFSLLRSKKTSDVIFSGSDNKSRLGMAQVTVTLDNVDGELPVDFAEVEITRRAYRDGNNEYLLNGKRVRLTDITEILAPTGLGKRTYALIGQGLIERVLSMAPEDLRSLFEEAAGITTHQSKRSAAIRRLDAAQMNLTRVKDITAEISPRLGYLQRQAERAEQRNLIAQRLRGMLEDWYGYHWFRARNQFVAKSEEATALESLVMQHRTELERLSQRIDTRRSEQATYRSELSELHRESSGQHREAERVGKDLAVAQERLRQMTARTETNQQELAPLRLQTETLAERITQSQATIASLQDEVAVRNQRVRDLQSLIAERQDSQRQLTQEISSLRDSVNRERTSVAQAESRLHQLDSRQSDLKTELEAEFLAKQEDTSHTEKLQIRAAEFDSRRINLQGQLSNKQEQVSATEAEIVKIRSDLDAAIESRQVADRELDRKQTRYDVLKRLRREGAGYASGVQAVLQASQQERLGGIRGTVASVLETPQNLDKAIETALGGAYQNVITSGWGDAQRAIEYLTSSGNGRATFLPLDRLHMMPMIAAPKRAGILGNAADLVSYDDGVADAIEQLLNRVWIADDLDAARAALDTISHGPRPTVVTLRGEIVRPGGAVSGGKDSRRRGDSVLQREREFRELPAQIESSSMLAEERAGQCNDLTGQIEALLQKIPPIQDELADLGQQMRVVQTEAADIERKRERYTQSREWHAARINQISRETEDSAQKKKLLGNDLEAAQVSLKEVEKHLLALEESANAEDVNGLLQQLADLRAKAAEAQGNLKSQSAILWNQQSNLLTTEEQIARREEQIASLRDESTTLTSAIAQLSQQESELGNQIAALQTKITPAEASLAQLETERAQSEAQERSLQDSLRKDEVKWNGAQLATQRAQDAIDQIRRDIEHEFGLVFVDESDEKSVQPPLPMDEIIQQLKPLDALPEDLDEDVRRMRRSLSRLKNVNPDAPREYAEAAERCDFLETQSLDLEEAIADMREVIAKLDTLMEVELEQTFAAVSEQFIHYFKVLFDGGTAKLSLSDAGHITTSGIEIVARPPGKRPQTLALLSGGERTLTACALIFAILRVSPTPFCVLDEVDAALDEANVDRFRYALEELSDNTQFILITHNRRTLEGTNAIYGVTMGSDGTSRVISLKLEGERIVQGSASAMPEISDDSGDQLSEIEEIVEI